MRRPISAYLRPAAYASAMRPSWASTLSVILPSLPAWSSALMAANPILKQSLLRLTTGVDVIAYTHCHIYARYGQKRPHIHHIVLIYRPSWAYQSGNGVGVGHRGLLLRGNTKKVSLLHGTQSRMSAGSRGMSHQSIPEFGLLALLIFRPKCGRNAFAQCKMSAAPDRCIMSARC